MTLITTPEASYVAAEVGRFFYPRAGDPSAPRGAKLLLLTRGGVCIVGHWTDDMVGWCPLPKRNHDKEAFL